MEIPKTADISRQEKTVAKEREVNNGLGNALLNKDERREQDDGSSKEPDNDDYWIRLLVKFIR
jgi:hypothetical protein